MDLKVLSGSLRHVHLTALNHSQKQVNYFLTLCNWLIGYYISNYQLNGADRAQYGEKLFETLESELNDIKGIDRRSLYRFVEFFQTYPQMISVVEHRFSLPKNEMERIVATVSPQFQIIAHQSLISFAQQRLDEPIDKFKSPVRFHKPDWTMRLII